MRDILFISHANPEDNEFCLWLALKLAKEGYLVWCDLTKLLGGEDFWQDAEETIRQKTAKFLLVLSRHSNHKEGPLQELHIAKSVARKHELKNFIIPLKIDDLPYNELNIQIARLHAISFEHSWAKGLRNLLERLEADNVPKQFDANPHLVTSWWTKAFNPNEGIIDEPEEYLSNWFPFRSLPRIIYLHKLQDSVYVFDKLTYPAFVHKDYLISFAPLDDFAAAHSDLLLRRGETLQLEYFLEGTELAARREAHAIVYHLLKLGWEKFLEGRDLLAYEFANRSRAFYFKKDMIENNVIWFTDWEGQKRHRQIVGKKGKACWHFAIQAKPLISPSQVFVIKPHVLFSDDGENIWSDKERLHKARRSRCRNWWNPDWRDRTLAVMSWLSNGAAAIAVPLAAHLHLEVCTKPVVFRSPVSYVEPTLAETWNAEYDDEDQEFEESVEV